MILIIDNYDSFTYNLYQIVAQFDNDVRVVRNDKITIAEIKALKPSGIIISPGPGRPEESGIAIAMVQQLYKEIPMLGVCLGHQIMTVAFGGQVILANEIVHGKEAYIFHQRDSIYKTMPLPFKAGRYHSLMAEAISLPKALIKQAENSEGIIMGIRHETYPIFGVQFHPESILTPQGEMIIKNFLDICQDSQRERNTCDKESAFMKPKRHYRESGNPENSRKILDSRFRGNDRESCPESSALLQELSK